MKRPRHDHIAFVRQGYLAVFMLLLDTGLIVLSLIVAYATKWHPLTQDRLKLTAVLTLVSLVCLLFAAGAVGGFRDMLAGGISSGPEVGGHRENDFFAKRRMVFFYSGVNLTLLTLAVLVEETGGITASPYVPVFFAFILTGQQLSRFRTQSTCLIGVGAALTVGMWAYESTAGLLKSPAAPSTLTTVLVVATFIACGLMTNYEKAQNYLVAGRRKYIPTQAHVYLDARGIWHYAIYSRRHRLDPVVHHEAMEATGTGRSLTAVQASVERSITSMYQAAQWDLPGFQWITNGLDSELTLLLPPKATESHRKTAAVQEQG